MDMLLRSTRILRKFQETMDTYCNSDYREKKPANKDWENSQTFE